MAIKPAGFLLATVTQGSADAFAQTNIVTGLSLLGGLGYQIREIVFSMPIMLAVDASNVTVSLSRRTKTAIPGLTDPDVITLQQRNVELATSGSFIADTVQRWTPAGPTYIVEDNLFLCIDSTSTSAANTSVIRIEYDVIRVTDNERNALLSRTILTTAQ